MKIQVLELPTEYLGEAAHTPFALVFSGIPESELEDVVAALSNFQQSEEPNTPEWTYATTLEVEL